MCYVIGKYLNKEADNSLSVTSDYLLPGAQWTVEKHVGTGTVDDKFIRFDDCQILLVNGKDIVAVSDNREVCCANGDKELTFVSYGSPIVISASCCLCVSGHSTFAVFVFLTDYHFTPSAH